MKLRCLVMDDIHDSLFPLLQQAEVQVDYAPDITREEVLAKADQYHGLVVRSKTMIDRQVLDQARQLLFVARAGAGVDNIDQDYAEQKGVTIINAPEGNRDAVAEQAVGMLLSLLNNVQRADDEVRQGLWRREENRGTELMSKTVGLIGYGYMGQAFAQRLCGFGCTVLAYDKYKRNYGDKYALQVSLPELQARSHIVSFHVPLTQETQHLYGLSFFKSFTHLQYMLNTARGKIVSLETLQALLELPQFRGMALDVLEKEPLDRLNDTQREAFRLLAADPRVVFTPHIAGWTYESYEKISIFLGEKIKAFSLAHRASHL